MTAELIITAVAGIIKGLIDNGPAIIKTVEDAKPFAEAIYHTLKGDNITQDQLTELDAHLKSLSDQLQKPLPPEET